MEGPALLLWVNQAVRLWEDRVRHLWEGVGLSQLEAQQRQQHQHPAGTSRQTVATKVLLVEEKRLVMVVLRVETVERLEMAGVAQLMVAGSRLGNRAVTALRLGQPTGVGRMAEARLVQAKLEVIQVGKEREGETLAAEVRTQVHLLRHRLTLRKLLRLLQSLILVQLRRRRLPPLLTLQ